MKVLASLSLTRRRPRGLQRAATIPEGELAATLQMAHDALSPPLRDVDLGETDQSEPETCCESRDRAVSGEVRAVRRTVPDPVSLHGAAVSHSRRRQRRLRRARARAPLGVVVLIPVIVIIVFIAIAIGSTG
jgi:hypothetical protein